MSDCPPGCHVNFNIFPLENNWPIQHKLIFEVSSDLVAQVSHLEQQQETLSVLESDTSQQRQLLTRVGFQMNACWPQLKIF